MSNNFPGPATDATLGQIERNGASHLLSLQQMRAWLLKLAPSILCAAQDSHRDAIAANRCINDLLQV